MANRTHTLYAPQPTTRPASALMTVYGEPMPYLTAPLTQIVLVPREQLRFTLHGRQFKAPLHLAALASLAPMPPAVMDFSQGEKFPFPLWMNDQEGDCFYEACCHGSQCFSANSGLECSFAAAAIDRRYRQLSGGDNGLADQQMIPEWKAGVVGPNGPRKVLSVLSVNPLDDAAVQMALWVGGGLIYTASLLDSWLRNIKPGVIWDGNGRPDPTAGHAMFLTGRRVTPSVPGGYTYDVRTWGLTPPIHLTPAGLRGSDPELLVAFSQDQFKADGTCAFTGMTWEQKRQLWQQWGGPDVGPSPFPPVPVPPPQPPSPPGPTPMPVTIPPWLLAVLKGLCTQANNLPTPWNALAHVLCGLLPSNATLLVQQGQGVAVHLPPWLLVILRGLCSQAGTLPAPYSSLATLVCGLLPTQLAYGDVGNPSPCPPCSGT